MAEPLAVPLLVRERALSWGDAGQRWLDDLPDVVASLAEEWGLHLGAPYSGGTAGYVVAAVDASGRECVLKVASALQPEDAAAFQRALVVHQLCAGRACAELLAHDTERRALLLERLGPNLHELGLPIPSVLDTVVNTLRVFWRPVDAAIDLPAGAEKAGWLARYITTTWEELDRPCDRAVVDRAVAFCERRAAAFDPSRAVLVHGDAHGWNTVQAGGGSCKLVDPEGLRSEPEHDLAAPLREYNDLLLAGDTARLVRQRAEHLASRCGADPEAVWEWGYVERVSTGLVNLRELDRAGGLAFLEVAHRSR